MEQDEKVMTFWDHLDELRSVLFRIVVVVALFTILGFCFKDQLFAVVLAPKESDFIFYRFLCRLSELLGMPGLCPGEFTSTLINTQLAGQFMMHAMVSAVYYRCIGKLFYHIPAYIPFFGILSGQS